MLLYGEFMIERWAIFVYTYYRFEYVMIFLERREKTCKYTLYIKYICSIMRNWKKWWWSEWKSFVGFHPCTIHQQTNVFFRVGHVAGGVDASSVQGTAFHPEHHSLTAHQLKQKPQGFAVGWCSLLPWPWTSCKSHLAWCWRGRWTHLQ